MGRTDDVINVAGHRLSTGSMEAVLAAHPAVAECAVIGVADDLKGQVPRGLVVLKAGVDAATDGELRAELVARVRDEIGAGGGASRQVDVVAGLPKTRSGKILRRTMREIADGKDAGGALARSRTPSVLDALRPSSARRIEHRTKQYGFAPQPHGAPCGCVTNLCWQRLVHRSPHGATRGPTLRGRETGRSHGGVVRAAHRARGPA